LKKGGEKKKRQRENVGGSQFEETEKPSRSNTPNPYSGKEKIKIWLVTIPSKPNRQTNLSGIAAQDNQTGKKRITLGGRKLKAKIVCFFTA